MNNQTGLTRHSDDPIGQTWNLDDSRQLNVPFIAGKGIGVLFHPEWVNIKFVKLLRNSTTEFIPPCLVIQDSWVPDREITAKEEVVINESHHHSLTFSPGRRVATSEGNNKISESEKSESLSSPLGKFQTRRHKRTNSLSRTGVMGTKASMTVEQVELSDDTTRCVSDLKRGEDYGTTYSSVFEDLTLGLSQDKRSSGRVSEGDGFRSSATRKTKTETSASSLVEGSEKFRLLPEDEIYSLTPLGETKELYLIEDDSDVRVPGRKRLALETEMTHKKFVSKAKNIVDITHSIKRCDIIQENSCVEQDGKDLITCRTGLIIKSGICSPRFRDSLAIVQTRISMRLLESMIITKDINFDSDYFTPRKTPWEQIYKWGLSSEMSDKLMPEMKCPNINKYGENKEENLKWKSSDLIIYGVQGWMIIRKSGNDGIYRTYG